MECEAECGSFHIYGGINCICGGADWGMGCGVGGWTNGNAEKGDDDVGKDKQTESRVKFLGLKSVYEVMCKTSIGSHSNTTKCALQLLIKLFSCAAYYICTIHTSSHLCSQEMRWTLLKGWGKYWNQSMKWLFTTIWISRYMYNVLLVYFGFFYTNKRAAI